MILDHKQSEEEKLLRLDDEIQKLEDVELSIKQEIETIEQKLS